MDHITVLLNEGVEYLNVKENGIYVDATLGGAGHSSLILSKLKTGHLYSFDQDEYAIKTSEKKLASISSNYTLIKANFRDLDTKLKELGVVEIDGIIYDLGVSSFQFDDEDRGFSYRFDAKLDMRMDQNSKLDAYQVVNTYDKNKLIDIFYNYGEEKYSVSIANNIVKYRGVKPIETTFELVDIIKRSLPVSELNKKGHPAKKVFQAIRIEVNDELNALKESLNKAIKLLKYDGRIVVITFQSLEDKIVKYLFRDLSTNDIPKGLPVKDDYFKPTLELVTKHPIVPSEEEITNNNRSHSAKMRVARKNI